MPPVYLLRHGETFWNREGRLQGSRDSALTARGMVQAARQGAILRARGVDCPAICSPQGRARMTAALAGLAPSTDTRLREISLGAWEGQLISRLAPPAGVTWKFDAPAGETLAFAQSRVADFLATLRSPVTIVTHGVISILIRAHLLQIPVGAWSAMDDPQGVVHRIDGTCETLLR